MFDFEFIYIIITSIIGVSSTSYVFYKSYKNIKDINNEDQGSK
jgi:hypothetical protein